MTRWEVLDLEVGEIVEDFYEKGIGIRIIIMRGPVSLCAYLGIPLTHPLAGFDCYDINLACHGGLTFASDKWPEGKGLYWYGWDYAHCDDATIYQYEYPDMDKNGKRWTIEEVKEEARGVAWDFARLMRLAERIQEKTRKEANHDS